MKKHYLHLRAYACDQCAGPVVAGSIGARENEISKETEVHAVGAICLTCGHRQDEATEPGITRNFPPALWDSTKAIDASRSTTA